MAFYLILSFHCKNSLFSKRFMSIFINSDIIQYNKSMAALSASVQIQGTMLFFESGPWGDSILAIHFPMHHCVCINIQLLSSFSNNIMIVLVEHLLLCGLIMKNLTLPIRFHNIRNIITYFVLF